MDNTLNMNNNTMTVSGNWSNRGTSDIGSGTVVFAGSGRSEINGSTNFYNFTCTTAGKTIEFDSTGTQSVEEWFTVTSSDLSNKIVLRSSDNIQASINANYSNVYSVEVSYINNTGRTIYAVASIDEGYNTGWYFTGNNESVWIGVESSDWDTAVNWVNGDIAETSDGVVIGSYVYALNVNDSYHAVVSLRVDSGKTVYVSNDQTLYISGAYTGAGTLDISDATVTVIGNFNASEGTVIFDGMGDLNLAGLDNSIGTFTAGSSTVTYNGSSDQNIAEVSYNNLIISGGGTKIAALDITVNGSLTVNQDLEVDGTVSVTGTASVAETIVSTGTQTYSDTVYITSDNAAFKSVKAINFDGAVTDGDQSYTIILQDDSGTYGTVNFNDNVTIGGIQTNIANYDIVFNGSLNTFDTDTDFDNTGTVTLGNESSDRFIFTGGLSTTATTGANIAGTIITVNNDMDFDRVTLNSNTILKSGSGNISAVTVTDGDNSYTLSLQAAAEDTYGSVTFIGAVNVNTLQTYAQDYSVILRDGGTIDTATTFNNTGGVTLLGEFTFTNGITSTASANTLSGSITTANSSVELGNITLTGSTSIDTGASTISGITLGTVTGAGHDLTVDAGSLGTVTIYSVSGVGTFTLTDSYTTSISGILSADSIIITDTSASFTVDGAVTSTELTTGATEYSIALEGGGTISNAATFSNTGGVTLAGDFTFTNGLTSTASANTLSGNITTTDNAITLGTVTLAGNTTLDAGTSADSDITLGAVTGDDNNLTIDAGASGAVTMISASGIDTLTLTDSDTTSVTGILSAGTIAITGTTTSFTVGGAITATVLTTGNSGYSLTLNGGGTVTNAVTLSNTGGVTLAGGFTFTNGLTSIVCANTLSGSITTTGSAVNIDSVTLAGNTVINSGASNNSDITLGAVTGGDSNLTIDAGSLGAVTIDSVSEVGTFTITDSATTSITGTFSADSVVITDTSTSVTFESTVEAGTINTGDEAYSVLLNNGGTFTNTATFNNAGDVELTGDFTFTNGLTSNVSTTLSGTITGAGSVVLGDTLISTSSSIDVSNHDISFDALTIGNLKTLEITTTGAGKIYFNSTIDSISGGSGNLIINTEQTTYLQGQIGQTTSLGTLTLQSGNFVTEGNDINVSNLTVTGGVFNYSDGSSVGNETWQISNALTIASNATLNATAGNLYISGDWNNSGTFNNNSGTVIFDGSGASAINGANTWYNFVSETAGKSLNFNKGELQTWSTNGWLNIHGSSGNHININNLDSNISSASNYSVAFVIVDNSDNSAGNQYITASFSEAKEGGTANVYWRFEDSYIWTGAVSSNWDDDGNWNVSPATIESTSDILIDTQENGYDLILTTSRTCGSFVIEAGKTVQVGTDNVTLTLTDIFVNYGSLTGSENTDINVVVDSQSQSDDISNQIVTGDISTSGEGCITLTAYKIDITDNITSSGSDIQFNGLVTAASASVEVSTGSASGGNITFTDNVDSGLGTLQATLTVISGAGDTYFYGNVGTDISLSNLILQDSSSTGYTIFANDKDVNIDSITTYAGNYSVAFYGDTYIQNATEFNNTGDLILGNDSGDTSSFAAGLDTSDSDNVSFAGTVSTAGSLLNTGDITLTTDVVLDTGNAAGSIISTGNITTNGYSFTVDSGSTSGATITLGEIADISGGFTIRDSGGKVETGLLGSTTESGSITITNSRGGVEFTGIVYAKDIIISNSESTTFSTTVNAETVNIVNTSQAIIFEEKLTAETLIAETLTGANGYSVALNGGGVVSNAVTFNNIGSVTLAGDFTFTNGVTSTASENTLSGTITTTDSAITFGTVTLAGNTTLDAGTSADSDITLGAVTGAENDLTIDAGSLGAVAITSASGIDTFTLIDSDTTSVTGILSAGTIAITDTTTSFTVGEAVTAETLTTGATGYSVALNGGGAVSNAVTFTNTGGVTLAGDFTFIGGITSTASVNTISESITASDSAIILGTVTLAGNTTLDAGTSANSDITLGVVTGGDNNLTIDAGSLGTVAITSASGIDTFTLTDSATTSVTGILSAGTIAITDTTTSFTVGGAVTAETLTTGAAGYSVALNGGGAVSNAVTFTNTGGVTLAGDFTFVGGVTSTASVNTISESITASDSAIILGTVTLAGNTTLDAGTSANSDITLGVVTGGDNNLTIDAGSLGTVAITSASGIDTFTLTDSATTSVTGILSAGTIAITDTTTSFTVGGAVTAETLTTGAAGYSVALNGGGAVSNAVTFSNTGGVTLAGNFTFIGGITSDASANTISGNITTSDSAIIIGTVTLAGNTTLDAGTSADSDITLGVVTGGDNNLTIDAGSLGTVAITSASGIDTFTLTDSATTSVTGILSAGTIAITDTTTSFTVGGAVTAETLTTGAAGYSVALNGGGAVSNAVTFSNTGGVTLAGNFTFIGGITSDASANTISGNITTSDSAIIIGTVTLAGNTTLDAGTSADSDITLGAVTAADNNLTIDAGSLGTVEIDSISGVDAFTLTDSDTTSIAGILSAGSITVTDTTTSFTVGGAVTAETLTTGAAGYSVALNGGGAVSNAVTFTNTGGVTLAGDFTFIGGVTSTVSANTISGSITTSDSAITLGTVTLAGNTTLDAGTSANSDITLGAVTGAENDLTIDAGPSGAVAITSASGIDTFTLTDSDTTSVTGILSAGTIAITDTTTSFTIGGAVTAETLTTGAAGYSVALNGGGAVSNAVTFTNTGGVTLAGDFTFIGGVTSTVSANTISGSITTSDSAITLGTVTLAGNTTLDAGTSANSDITLGAVTGAENDLTIDAGPSGAVAITSASGIDTFTLTDSDTTSVTGILSAGTIAITDTTTSFTIGGAVTAETLTTGAAGYSVALNGGGAVSNALTFTNTGGVTLAGNFTFIGGVTSTASANTISGSITTSDSAIILGTVTLAGNTTLDAGTSADSDITLGAITGGDNDLTIDAGSLGTVEIDSVSGVNAFTLTDSDTTSIAGILSVGSITITDTTTSFMVNGGVFATSLSTTANEYSIELNGGGEIDEAVTLNNIGGVTIGDDASDEFIFHGGVTSNASMIANSIAGTITVDSENLITFGDTYITSDSTIAGGIISIGNVTLEDDVTLTLGSGVGSGNITVTSISGTSGGDSSNISVNTAGSFTLVTNGGGITTDIENLSVTVGLESTIGDVIELNGTFTKDGAGELLVQSASITVDNLIISDGTFTGGECTATIYDNILIDSDTVFNAFKTTVVYGDWDNSNGGTFNHSDGEVIFNGMDSVSTISGSNTWYKLTSEYQINKTLTFNENDLQNIEYSLSLIGNYYNSIDNNQYSLKITNFTCNVTAANYNVAFTKVTNSTSVDTIIIASFSEDGGNNENWTFQKYNIWTGAAGDGNWDNDNNWSTLKKPSSDDADILLNTQGNNSANLSISALSTISVANITIINGSALVFNGGTLEISSGLYNMDGTLESENGSNIDIVSSGTSVSSTKILTGTINANGGIILEASEIDINESISVSQDNSIIFNSDSAASGSIDILIDSIELSTSGTGTITLGSAVYGFGFNLTIDAGAGDVNIYGTDQGNAVNKLSITAGDNSTTIYGDIYTLGTQTYNGHVVIAAAITFDADNADITFNGSISGSVDGTEDIIIDSGSGAVTFNSSVGEDILSLGNITITRSEGGVTFNGETYAKNLTITDGGAVDINSNMELSEALISSGTTFDSTGSSILSSGVTIDHSGAVVTGTGINSNAGNVDIDSGSTLTINGLIETTTGNISLDSTEETILNSDIATDSGNITFANNKAGNTILGQDIELTAEIVEFYSTVDSKTGGNNSLTITGNTVFYDSVGSTSALAELTIYGTTTLNSSITTTGEQSYSGDIILFGNSQTITLSSGDSNITITGSIIDNGSNSLTFNAGSGTVTQSSGNSIAITGTLTKQGSGAFDTNGNNIAAESLVVSGGTFNSDNEGGTWSIQNNVGIAIGAVLNSTSDTLTVGGNWANLGTFNNNSGTVEFNGSSDQQIDAGYSAFYNVTLNTSSIVSLLSDMTITNNLTLSSGMLALGISELAFGVNATISGTPSSSAMILIDSEGKVKKYFDETGTFVFTIGTASLEGYSYTPITVEFTNGVFSTEAFLEVGVYNTKAEENTSPTNYLNRHWTVDSSGISNFSANITCQYVESDVVGNEADIYFGNYFNGSWNKYSLCNTANHTMSAYGINSFGIITGIDKSLDPDPVDVNLINDGTQFKTMTGWLNIIDQSGPEEEEITIDIGEMPSDGEYAIGYPEPLENVLAISVIPFETDKTFKVDTSRKAFVASVENSIFSTADSDIDDSDIIAKAINEFNINYEDCKNIVNFAAIEASNHKHPTFKTELDLILEQI